MRKRLGDRAGGVRADLRTVVRGHAAPGAQSEEDPPVRGLPAAGEAGPVAGERGARHLRADGEAGAGEARHRLGLPETPDAGSPPRRGEPAPSFRAGSSAYGRPTISG